MPKINTQRETTTVTLDTLEGAKITLRTKVLLGDMQDVEIGGGDGMTAGDMVGILSRLITDWDLTDQNDNPLEICRENILLLSTENLKELMDEADIDWGSSDEGKKK